MVSILTCKASKNEIGFKRMVDAAKRLSKDEFEKEVQQADKIGIKKLTALCEERYYSHPINRSKRKRRR